MATYVSTYGHPQRYGPTTQAMYQHMANLGWNPDDCNRRYDLLVNALQDSDGNVVFEPGDLPVDLQWFNQSVSLWYRRGDVFPPPAPDAAPPLAMVFAESITNADGTKGTWRRPDWYDGPAPSQGGTVPSA